MSGAPPRSAAIAPPLGRDVAAAVALAAYSLVVAAGFARVFGGWDFLTDLAIIVLVGHGASLVLRRVGVSAWIAVPGLAVLLLWVIVLQQYRETTSALLPTAETWELFRLETDLVREQFRTAVAPVFYGAGWAPLAAIGVAAVVLVADTFAFRAHANGEALAPGGVLFVVVAALGTDRDRITLTAALVATGYVAVVALRALHDRSRRVELVARRGARSGLVPAVLGAAACVAVVAAVVGPRLPGADSDALYDTRNRGGTTLITSPLVSIRSRLVNQRNLEVFRVNATAESYWRLTALPEFDGESFRLPDRPLTDAGGQLTAPRPTGEQIVQQIQIRELGSRFLPAAADPVEVSPADQLNFNADTSTLVTVEDELGFGAVYDVVSSSPRLAPDELRAATSSSVGDPIHLALPDDFPAEVADLAAQVTAGATTNYDRAIQLQTWFRDEFDYSLDVQRGHDTSAIESFLNERVGYCEQFAATFAAMARTLDIPSRVAVGFTPGLRGADGWFSVLGKNAHAWPELWFDGIGWVPFEPTPGRGVPGGESYTGLAPAQDTEPNTGTGDGTSVRPDITTPPSFALPNDPDAASTTLPSGGLPAPVPPTDQGGDGGGLPVLPFAVVALLAAAAAAPAVVRRVRHRLRARGGAVEEIRQAWELATDAARRAGVRITPAMTPRQVATATAAVLPVAARPMWSLAGTVDAVTYGRPGSVDLDAVGTYGTSIVRDCQSWARQVDGVVDDNASTSDRVRRYFTTWT